MAFGHNVASYVMEGTAAEKQQRIQKLEEGWEIGFFLEDPEDRCD